jgi:phosphatidylinositol glycan class W
MTWLQEHVAEYGVHWNFFFTLAGVALLTSLIHVPPTYCGSLGIAILSGTKAQNNTGILVVKTWQFSI